MGVEEQLQQSLFGKNPEKSFLDKVLAKEDIASIRELIKKDRLSRSELLELLYLLSSSESKLVNFGSWERYVILKFFVWIREFVKVAEILYDYQEKLEEKEKVCACGGELTLDKKTRSPTKCTNCQKPTTTFQLSARARHYLENNQKLIEHNAKFLIDLYLNICRTSLSLGATGFKDSLSNKFEMTYDDQRKVTGMPTNNNTAVSASGGKQ